jgi:hypothetical protein
VGTTGIDLICPNMPPNRPAMIVASGLVHPGGGSSDWYVQWHVEAYGAAAASGATQLGISSTNSASLTGTDAGQTISFGVTTSSSGIVHTRFAIEEATSCCPSTRVPMYFDPSYSVVITGSP